MSSRTSRKSSGVERYKFQMSRTRGMRFRREPKQIEKINEVSVASFEAAFKDEIKNNVISPYEVTEFWHILLRVESRYYMNVQALSRTFLLMKDKGIRDPQTFRVALDNGVFNIQSLTPYIEPLLRTRRNLGVTPSKLETLDMNSINVKFAHLFIRYSGVIAKAMVRKTTPEMIQEEEEEGEYDEEYEYEHQNDILDEMDNEIDEEGYYESTDEAEREDEREDIPFPTILPTIVVPVGSTSTMLGTSAIPINLTGM